MISAAVLAPLVSRYRTRILPAAEWAKLAGTELEPLAPLLRPEDTRIVVVEDGDQIVACWAVTRMVHLEGIWIAPTHRKRPGVGMRLLAMARAQVKAFGATFAYTGAQSEDVRAMLTKIGGQRIEADAYIVPIRGEQSCQRQL